MLAHVGTMFSLMSYSSYSSYLQLLASTASASLVRSGETRSFVTKGLVSFLDASPSEASSNTQNFMKQHQPGRDQHDATWTDLDISSHHHRFDIFRFR